MTLKTRINYIDLFSGIGGFHLALSNFNTNCVFASEWDNNCQDVYFDNFNIRPHGDITKIDEKEIPQHDILCAGFPCQAFSISGKRLGFKDTRGTLFFDVARIAKYHKPKVLILENVKNFKEHDNGKTLSTVLRTLDEIGYNTFYDVLSASDYGVPQKRERIYFVSFKKNLKIKDFKFRNQRKIESMLKDIVLPDKETKEYVIKRNDIYLNKQSPVKDMFGNYPQKSIRVGIVNKGGQGERIYSQFGHAIALTAYGGGVGAKTGLYQINNKIRKLAPRECARLFGFPEDFKLHEKDSVSYKQFGNSVVVNVLKDIIQKIFDKNIFT